MITTGSPSEMRVVQIGAHGPGLSVGTRPVPEPAAGEVLVRVAASSINARDLPIVEQRYSMPVPDGRIPVSDGAGVVERVGAGVTRYAEGDRVMSLFHPSWLHGRLSGWGELYGVTVDGWLAEYVAVGEQSLVAVPEHLSLVEAATLPCAALTGWNAVAGAGPGDTVLVQGSGGVSVFAAQFARIAGARLLATTSSEEKADRFRALGADDVVDHRTTPQWGSVVRTIADGRGVDLAVEIGGAGTIAQSLEALVHGGTISLVGNLAAGQGMDLGRFLGRGATLRTITVGSRHDAERMNRVVARHRLRPVIDRVFGFDRAPEAFAHFAGASRFGKVVIEH